MSTTITFEDAKIEGNDNAVLVRSSIGYFNELANEHTSFDLLTWLEEAGPHHRVTFITNGEKPVLWNEPATSGNQCYWLATKLDPNEAENNIEAIKAELAKFQAQTIVLPTDDPDIAVAVAVAHQIVSGARYDWG